MVIPLPLPYPTIETQWRMVTDELRRTKAYWPQIEHAALEAAKQPGWNPKTVQLGGHLVALDYSFRCGTDEVTSYLTGIVVDHPFLSTLPQNAPRSVKHIYRKDVRLRYLRAKEGWGFLRDWNAAQEAAEEYNRCSIIERRN